MYGFSMIHLICENLKFCVKVGKIKGREGILIHTLRVDINRMRLDFSA